MKMQQKHPIKWRNTCDPFRLPYHSFQLNTVLGYPHAGNDVFHVQGVYHGKSITAYVKVARQQSASIENEVAILSQLDGAVFPKIIDFDYDTIPFSVSMEMPGIRLSSIVGENEDMCSLSFMEEYGEALSKLHKLEPNAPQQADRRFFHCPSADMLEKLQLPYLSDYFQKPPSTHETVFCHGDFHYANVLWDRSHISAILDFELVGYGDRDFDIAWALFLRPGQKFLKSSHECSEFLKGYGKHGAYDSEAVKYYMAQCYVHFLSFCGDDTEYCEYVRSWLLDHCT